MKVNSSILLITSVMGFANVACSPNQESGNLSASAGSNKDGKTEVLTLAKMNPTTRSKFQDALSKLKQGDGLRFSGKELRLCGGKIRHKGTEKVAIWVVEHQGNQRGGKLDHHCALVKGGSLSPAYDAEIAVYKDIQVDSSSEHTLQVNSMVFLPVSIQQLESGFCASNKQFEFEIRDNTHSWGSRPYKRTLQLKSECLHKGHTKSGLSASDQKETMPAQRGDGRTCRTVNEDGEKRTKCCASWANQNGSNCVHN